MITRIAWLTLLAAAPPGPDAQSVYIEKLTTGGDGCPSPAAVTTLLSEDRRTFLLIYARMQLAHPPGPDVTKRHCKLTVHLHLPKGWQVALADVTTRGYAYLEPGMLARLTSSYRLAGVPLGAEFTHTLAGPQDDFYDFSDELASRVWSKCGGPGVFALTTTLTLDTAANPDGQAIFNASSSDGRFARLLRWDWRPC